MIFRKSRAKGAIEDNAAGDAFRRSYFATGNAADLDQAIAAYRRAHANGADTDEYTRSMFANNLGSMLGERYKLGNHLGDLNEAISALEQADALTPDTSPYKKMIAGVLALATQQLFNRTREAEHIEGCARYFRRAYELTEAGSDERAAYAGYLAPTAERAYRMTKKVVYCDWALEAFELFAPDAEKQGEVRGCFASLLADRFNRSNDPNDLDRAIENLHKAVEQPIDDQALAAAWRIDLSRLLLLRYTLSRKPQDLETADHYSAGQAAPNPEAMPNPRTLSLLAHVWKQRFEMTGVDADLEQAIAAGEAALRATAEDDVDRVRILGELGTLLCKQFARAPSESVRSRQAEVVRQVLDLRRFNTDDAIDAVQDFGQGLQDQYTAGGRIADLEAAIDCFQALARSVAQGSRQFGALQSALGNALGDSYARTESREDLERGLACHQQAVANLAGAPRATALTNLGTHLHHFYRLTGQPEYLNQQIEACEQCIAATDPASAELPARLDNLGAALADRFDASHDIADLDRAIELHQRALALLTKPTEERVGVLNNLAVRLHTRFLKNRREADREQSVATFRWGAKEGLQYSRGEALKAARNWLNFSFQDGHWADTSEAYQYFNRVAITLLGVQAERKDKEAWLRELATVPARAAYAFAKLGALEKAVVTLEDGSARLLAEALRHRRKPSAPAGSSLDQRAAGARETPVDRPSGDTQQPPDTAAGAAFAKVVAAAKVMPLVYLCATEQGGLALVVHDTGEVRPVWLPKLKRDEIQRVLVGSRESPGYLQAYIDWRANPAQEAARKTWCAALARIAAWQAESAIGQIVPELVGKDGLVFISAGELSVLPWHASPLPGGKAGTGHLIDRFTVRYAPVASAVRTGAAGERAERLFAVNDPQPVDGKPLPYSALEIASCRAQFDTTDAVSGACATAQALIAGINWCDVFHFAGHAASDLEVPLRGGLEVSSRSRLTLENLLQESHTGRLAVLSACETGVPGLRLPEEAIGLSSGFLQIGFAGVVASLWAVADASTFFLMDRFYELWRKEKRDPAGALCRAQCWLRDAPAAELRTRLEQRKNVLATGELAQLRERLESLPPGAQPFAHAFFWAPFSFSGA
jgi:CHAT domain-containing protein